MDTDLEEWRYQELGVKPRYLLPSWGPLATLIWGLEPPPAGDQAVAKDGCAPDESQVQPKPPWYTRACALAGRQLIALGRRLEPATHPEKAQLMS